MKPLPLDISLSSPGLVMMHSDSLDKILYINSHTYDRFLKLHSDVTCGLYIFWIVSLETSNDAIAMSKCDQQEVLGLRVFMNHWALIL